MPITASYPPVCPGNQYVFSTTKTEDMNADVCFGVTTGCTDPVVSGSLVYAITGGNGTGLIRLNTDSAQSTNSQISLCSIQSLKGQYGSYQVSDTEYNNF